LNSEAKITDAYIALGANLGDRAGNIRRALAALNQVPGVRICRVSTLIDNPAVGGPAGSPAFLNAVARVETTLLPEQLLERLLAIESAMGRERREQWEPRLIDLDLILFGQLVVSEEGLVIPHPRLHERRFVLGPLAELAPDLVHPVLVKTVRALLDELLDELPPSN
jgi:2-amino-4-hydroxy-6-hydroxymethyldihydropteridine diphosphokinase